MDSVFFRVIIPNYNNGSWLRKCIESVERQSFKDYKIIVVDDNSSDNSVEVINSLVSEYDNIVFIPMEYKVYNGGARNVGLRYPINSEYTLFLDSDDWYCSDNILEEIHKCIVSNEKPDCVSLSYRCLIGENASYQRLIRNSGKELVDSLFVACWTKCIKSSLMVMFPENTLMEDVVQHIGQCDRLESFVSLDIPCICWNRNNTNSCSRVENQDCQNGKWQSSMYRYAADLMDLVCCHGYCEEHRKWRLNIVLENIKNGVYVQ